MTPSHVYGLWTSINSVIARLSQLDSYDSNLTAAVNEIEAGKHSGKKPYDVFQEVSKFKNSANTLLTRNGLRHLENDKDIPETGISKNITPSDVFLKSGYVLDALVLLLISKTDEHEYISGHYTDHNFSKKTPSDVYALVEQANENIQLLLR